MRTKNEINVQCLMFSRDKLYDENMSILSFILISRDLYQTLMNTN